LSAENQWKFDHEKTLRVKIRGKLKLKDIQAKLSKFDIVFFDPIKYEKEWNNIKILENPEVFKVQYIYLEFKSKADAEKAYNERKEIFKKEEGSIATLYESYPDFIKRCEITHPENVLVVYKPSTSQKISDFIPPKAERIAQLHSLLSIITGLDKEQIKLIPSLNKVTNSINPDQIFVILPSKLFVHKAFVSQPFFKHLIVDKLIYGHFYCELKADRAMCARCSLPFVFF